MAIDSCSTPSQPTSLMIPPSTNTQLPLNVEEENIRQHLALLDSNSRNLSANQQDFTRRLALINTNPSDFRVVTGDMSLRNLNDVDSSCEHGGAEAFGMIIVSEEGFSVGTNHVVKRGGGRSSKKKRGGKGRTGFVSL